MAVGAVVARILTQYSDKGSKAAQKDIAKLGKSFDAFGKNAVRAFGLATAAVGAFAVKVGKDAVNAAIADQKSQALLANSLRNTVGATNAAIASVESYVSQLQIETGVVDDDLRPALSRLAAVTGNVTSAQKLLGTALDVSAFATVDLGTATRAITRALAGNFRGLQNLVPGLDLATLKSKDFAAILKQVNEITSGAAATRAGTLEYRLQILRIRYDEILETLGYSLLPVLEEFSQMLTREILPQISRWISLNKAGLADGLRNAADAALELLKAAIKIGTWFVNNFETIKNFGIVLASLWATGRVYAFVTAIGKVALAFKGMQAAAAGAAIASSAATGAGSAGLLTAIGKGGALAAGAKVLGVAALPLAAIGAAGFAVRKAGNDVRARRAKLEESLAGYRGAPGPSDLATIGAGDAAQQSDGMKEYLAFLNRIQQAQDKLNGKKKKELTTEQKIINAMLKKYGLSLMTAETEAKATAASISANLTRQSEIAKGAKTVSLAAQGDGSASGSIVNSGAPQVQVNITTPYGTKDDFFVDVQANLNTLRRRAGMTPSGRMTGIGIE